jgi:hypothetical protein
MMMAISSGLIFLPSLMTLSAQQLNQREVGRTAVVTPDDKLWTVPGKIDLSEGFEHQVVAGPTLGRATGTIRSALARDHEARVYGMADGRSVTAVIKIHPTEGMHVADVGGTEYSLPHVQMVSETPLPDYPMPVGLDESLTERGLTDLVAWLKSPSTFTTA